ncbi:hypothetical protein LAU_0413 [Lausannevirus]|uniref:Uncharacterized protein n=2 Tax=Lausannevirus TaxID=999883 RepID=A0A0N9PZD0_9VIRU|nr:hypothetical protein LAU_0413 [Lausannevirus]AEA07263.1 hypothetical protein LAU_0413 [Lausannevirus]ALH07070.1 hypothetical protein PMV_372 [Port-miou virus]
MQGETFEYNGTHHISKKDGGIYLVNEKWPVNILAKALWERHGKMLQWREYDFGSFYAFVEGGDDYVAGSLTSCDSMIINALSPHSKTTREVSDEMTKATIEVVVDVLAK